MNKSVKGEGYQDIVVSVAVVVFSFLTGFLYFQSAPARLLEGVLLLVMSVCLLAGACSRLSVFVSEDKNREMTGFYTLLSIAFFVPFIIKAEYILYTPTWIRQHDVIGFGNSEGQAAYIEHFFNTLKLPDFDPRKKWGFFQPPLHHIIAGLWLRLQMAWGGLFGWSADQCRENVQALTLIYSSLTAWFGIRIMRRLRLSGLPLLCGAFLIAAHPCLIQMAGSINNDMLCVFLQIMGMFFFVCWMEDEKTSALVTAAVFMGLSMMAKLSGIMLAAPMGCIMLYRLISAAAKRDMNRVKKLAGGYVLFGIISIPLGIWYPVRNLIKFGIPLTYTPKVGEKLTGHSILDRLFFGGDELTPFTCLKATGHGYDEFNVPLAILKTSLFGEADFSQVSPLSTPIAWVMLVCGSLLALVTALMFIWLWNKKKNRELLAFLGIYIGFSLAFLLRLCFAIPNFSSQDFRYIAHIIVPSAVVIAMALGELKGFKKNAVLALGLVFGAASLAQYALAGIVTWN